MQTLGNYAKHEDQTEATIIRSESNWSVKHHEGTPPDGGAVGVLGKGRKGWEYSHAIPVRLLKRVNVNSWFGRTAVNGTYVPRWFHALSDQYRFRFMPRIWKESLPFLLPQGIQQAARVPPAWSVAGAGATLDSTGGRSNGP